MIRGQGGGGAEGGHSVDASGRVHEGDEGWALEGAAVDGLVPREIGVAQAVERVGVGPGGRRTVVGGCVGGRRGVAAGRRLRGLPRRMSGRGERRAGGQEQDGAGTHDGCLHAGPSGRGGTHVISLRGSRTVEMSTVEQDHGFVLACQFGGCRRRACGVEESVDLGGRLDVEGILPSTPRAQPAPDRAHLTPSAPGGTKVSRTSASEAGRDPSRRASVARPRCAAERTAPGRLPRTAPAVVASRAITARSITASAWSGGRLLITASAAAVVKPSSIALSVSTESATSIPVKSWSTRIRRDRWRNRSKARWRPIVVIHPRKPSASPVKRSRSRHACPHVSEATSSASLGPTRTSR